MLERKGLIVILTFSVLLLVAAIPLATYKLGPEIQISTPSSPQDANRYIPVVAYNGVQDEFLVVWHNQWLGNRDIYAQRVSRNGTKLGSCFTITSGVRDRFQSALAYNAKANQYLVVWMYDPDGTHYEVWGRIVAWNGSWMGNEFQIFSWPNRAFWAPRVAWNSYQNEYMVISNASDTTNGKANDVARRRVMVDGSTPDPGSSVFQSQVYMPHQGDITYNVAADRYLVVWRQFYYGGDWDIYGVFLNRDGTLYGTPFPINAVNTDQRLPSVTTNGQGNYLVVYEQVYPGPCCDWDIYGQDLDFSGTPVGDSYPISNSYDDETYPFAVARFGNVRDYLVVFQRTTSTGERIRAVQWKDPEVGPSGWSQWFTVADYAFWKSEHPTAAIGRSGYLISYEGDSVSDPTIYRHVYGSMLFFETTFLPLIKK